MKKILFSLIGAFISIAMLNAQSRLPLKIYVEDMPAPFPANAKVQMTNKISQMLTANGIASTNIYNNFFITVVANPVEKQVVNGAPTQIVQELDFNFYIVDGVRKIVFSTYSTSAKGVGSTETRSYLDAIKRAKISSSGAAAFIAEGKKKIIAYYEAEMENIFARAKALAQQKKFDEAFYELNGIPTECSQYSASLALGNEIYQSYVDYTAQQNLAQARSAWAAEQNSLGATIAGKYLAEILPEASCYNEAMELYTEIKAKVREDWEWEMKKYQDGIDLEKLRIASWQAVGVAYGENQPDQTVTMNWIR